MSESVMVFWGYDLPPYVSAAEGTIDSLGRAYLPSYQMTIKRNSILAVYPLDKGILIKTELEAAKEEFNERIQQAKMKLCDVVEKALPESKEYLKKSFPRRKQ